MDFRQKIAFELSVFPYRLRSIADSQDFKAVLQLREHCFQAKIDKLPFDLQGDHLIVEDLRNGKICGTYRVSHSQFCKNFECEEDFQIQGFLQKGGNKLELAWACIDPEYRNGSILSLLWRGISEIAKQTKTQYIFGITSINEKVSDVAMIREALRHYELPMEIKPQCEKRCHQLNAYVLRDTEKASAKSFRKLIPGLLRAYLLAGAFVCSEPSFDPDLNCFDFMTVMEVDQLTEGFNHHYKMHSGVVLEENA
jgi:putative hemolysin